MCACIPLVWLTQPAALSQGCRGRAGDLHPPSGQIGSSLARNPKMGKAIDAVRRVAVSAAGVRCVMLWLVSGNLRSRIWGLHLRHTRAKASQQSLDASLRGLTEFAVALASPNTDGRNTKTKQKVSLKFQGSTPRNSRKEKRETIKYKAKVWI